MTVSAPPLPKLLTVNDLAQIFDVSRATIYRWRSEGKPLPRAIQIGSCPRWHPDEVARFVAEQEGTGDL
ncbi:helix-turn-helix domain-containing protein [Actinomycetaceae bacterium WB03_NA08]|uniref:Helix-turn-helix domain-containing protein n=1 Tax=Scrofimicrobium canadense TaxID=2652290 RepID=A0A6N7W993_9ACTO|nr:helix-turn-helix domain-containing protein [Scrofimicrobium canadense]MSS85002.1 helix-turn-helix domain-containing protein [Scrofimicrobium canadense]